MNEHTNLTGSQSAEEIVALDKRHVWHPYTQHGVEVEPPVIARAKGVTAVAEVRSIEWLAGVVEQTAARSGQRP